MPDHSELCSRKGQESYERKIVRGWNKKEIGDWNNWVKMQNCRRNSARLVQQEEEKGLGKESGRNEADDVERGEVKVWLFCEEKRATLTCRNGKWGTGVCLGRCSGPGGFQIGERESNTSLFCLQPSLRCRYEIGSAPRLSNSI